MINIVFPKYDFKLKQENNKDFIYDNIRNKWIMLTPEEWVRQHIIKYLQTKFLYPSSLFAIEKEIQVGELKKRFDIVIYKDAIPWMIIECKQNDYELDSKVMHQVLNYFSTLQTKYMAITNGSNFYLWIKEENELKELDTFPKWF